MTEIELTDKEIDWLRDCKARGFDPVAEIQRLRSDVAVLNDKCEKLLAGWVPPAHWPEEAWTVLVEREMTEKVDIGDRWVLFRIPAKVVA